MKIKEKVLTLAKKYHELLSYLFFGVLTTIVSFVTFVLMENLVDAVIANIISWIVSVTFAYITNRIFVFESKKHGKEILGEVATFFGSRAFSGILETGIIFVFVNLLTCNSMIVKAVATVITIILNYVLSKLLVFKKAKKQ